MHIALQGKYFTFMFREPKYPVICNFDGFLICGKSEAEFYKYFKARVPESEPESTGIYTLIDAALIPWFVNSEQMLITPQFGGRKVTKLNLIELFNQSKNAQIVQQTYSSKSLSSKKTEKIFNDIYRLIDASLNTAEHTAS